MYRFLLIIICYIYLNPSKAQNGDNLFDDTFIHTIEMNSIESYSYDEFHGMLKDTAVQYFGTGINNRPNFPVSIIIDGNIIDTVGIRYKGFLTFSYADIIGKYPIKVDINEYVSGQEYDGLKKFNLHNNLFDNTCIRAKLSMEIMENMGVPAPRVSYAKVYLNGSYRGLYSIVEQIDKAFVRDRFPSDTTGYLHKSWGLTMDVRETFIFDEVLQEYVLVTDTVPEYYQKIAPLKTKKSTNNYQPLINLSIASQYSTNAEFENDIAGNFDLTSFIQQEVVTVFVEDSDHYCPSNRNFYVYRNPPENKWYMIPWDYDLAFGINGNGVFDPPAVPDTFSYSRCFLNKRMMEIPSLKVQYQQTLCDLLEFGVDSIWVNNRIDEIANMIAIEVENDPFFWDISDYFQYLEEDYTISNPFSPIYLIPALRPFLNDRRQEIKQSLMNENFVCGETMVSTSNPISISDINLVPNPSNDIIEVTNNSFAEITKITIVNLMGQEIEILQDLAISKGENYAIDLSSFANGIYYLRLELTEKEETLIKTVLKL